MGLERKPLSPEEVEKLASLLARVPEGRLEYKLWLEMTRLTVGPSYEVVPVLLDEGAIQVLLFQRPEKDPHFPGQWHAPGVMILPTDGTDPKCSFNETWKRLQLTELSEIDYGDNVPVQVGAELTTSPRGTGLVVVNFLPLCSRGNPGTNGRFFGATELPGNLVDSHRDIIIPRAVEAFASSAFCSLPKRR